MNYQPILRAFDRNVYDLVQPYRVTRDEGMPVAYQNIPGGRPLHDDWAVMSSVRRIDTAYNVPLPFKQIAGLCVPQWLPWDPNYPASPGLRIENRPYQVAPGDSRMVPYALVDCAVEGSGTARFACFINGAWVPVFRSYRRVIFGRLFANYSGGLKQDLTVSYDANWKMRSDVMGWWDPPSLSYNKVA